MKLLSKLKNCSNEILTNKISKIILNTYKEKKETYTDLDEELFQEKNYKIFYFNTRLQNEFKNYLNQTSYYFLSDEFTKKFGNFNSSELNIDLPLDIKVQ